MRPAARIIGAHRRTAEPQLTDFRQDFLAFALARDVLRFGEFVTKAGRLTPYFFNAGLFNDGESLRRLGQFYAEAALTSGLKFDQLFGPAYKGITLAAATSYCTCRNGAQFAVQFQSQGGEGSRRRRQRHRRAARRSRADRRRRHLGGNVGARVR
jgi:orotate phosphoribosyltransferase